MTFDRHSATLRVAARSGGAGPIDRHSATLRVAARSGGAGPIDRRQLLGGLGITGASTVLWALGCGGVTPEAKETSGAEGATGEVKAWLRDAVARLATAFPTVHVLAVARRRTTAARDVVDANVVRGRRDGVVFTVRDRDGVWRELATSELSEAGVAAAARALTPNANVGKREPKRAPAKRPLQPPPAAPPNIDDDALRDRVEAISRYDKPDSRVIYAVALVDLEDATVWSIAPGQEREQRLVRIRERVVRVAWNRARPVVGEAERVWTGGLGDKRQLDEKTVKQATRRALELMTPGTLEDRERIVILEPSVTAALVDAGTRALLTSAAARRPEVGKRIVIGATVAAPMVTLVDDPGVRGAYGGFTFDDEGELAQRITLIDRGRLAGTLSDRAGGGRGRGRRPGHIGAVEPSPSHLVLAPGNVPHSSLADDGFILEGGGEALVDPSSARVVISAQRAREIKGGQETGRVYPDVELVGDLAALLAAVSGVSSDTTAIGFREERDGEPLWRSVDAPWLRTQGLVRARRRLG